MTRRLLAVLFVIESAVFCAIVACSLQLSREITRSSSAQQLVHAVVRTTQQVAARIAHVTLD
jgi:CHASE3 domain sensor protein